MWWQAPGGRRRRGRQGLGLRLRGLTCARVTQHRDLRRALSRLSCPQPALDQVRHMARPPLRVEATSARSCGHFETLMLHSGGSFGAR